MINENHWNRILELHEEMFLLLTQNIPSSVDAVRQFKDIRSAIEEEIEMIRENEPKDSITETVVRQIINRSKMGEITYGHSMDREDMTLEQWLTEFIPELMDAAVYGTKALVIERNKNEGI